MTSQSKNSFLLHTERHLIPLDSTWPVYLFRIECVCVIICVCSCVWKCVRYFPQSLSELSIEARFFAWIQGSPIWFISACSGDVLPPSSTFQVLRFQSICQSSIYLGARDLNLSLMPMGQAIYQFLVTPHSNLIDTYRHWTFKICVVLVELWNTLDFKD